MGRAVGAAVSGGIQFVYAPNGAKMEVMSGSTLLRADIPLPGGGEAVYNTSGLAYYRHPDHLGSSRLASTAAPALNAATSYAPYGEAYAQTGAIDLSFTGQKQDISGGQYDFLMREYNPIQGRWWTPDPAGMAAVNPSNPQSWNRYGYMGGMPLNGIDPWGLAPCWNASLHKPNDNTANSDDAGSNFGPSDSTDEPMQAAGGDCGGGWQQCSLDGVNVDCGLMWNLGGGGGGIGGGGDASTLDECAWYDCGVTINGQDGDPHRYQWQWTDKAGPCQPNPPFVGCNGRAWGNVRVEVQPGCGWDISCHFFVGFGNLFVNDRPSGALELGGSLAAGSLVAAISGAGGVAATLFSNSVTIKPGCGAPLAATGAGAVGSVFTIGSALAADRILPEVFRGAEGLMNLDHFAPAGVSAVLVLGAGVGGLQANGCF